MLDKIRQLERLLEPYQHDYLSALRERIHPIKGKASLGEHSYNSYGYRDGYGYGYLDGNGNGVGNGYPNGDGSGNGYGYEDGCGYKDGSGNGEDGYLYLSGDGG